MADIKKTNKGKFTISTATLVAMVVAGLSVGLNIEKTVASYKNYPKQIIRGFENVPLVSDRQLYQYIKMQQSLPEGETVITVLKTPFVLDFRRNRIFIADVPGGASPPPGMPSFKGGEALANYLVSKSIRYIAYEKESGFLDKKEIEILQSQAEEPTWGKTLLQHAFDFRDNFEKLYTTRKKLYDEGNVVVIDLFSHIL